MPIDLIIKISVTLIVICALIVIFMTGAYKKVFNKKNASTLGKSSSKVGKDLVKSGSQTVTKLKSIKPTWPGGIKQPNKIPATVTTPAVIPKQQNMGTIEVVNPKPQFLPDRYIGMIELVYMNDCNEVSLHETYEDGTSIEFSIVAEWDKKNRRYRAWLYNPRPHVDTRKSNQRKQTEYSAWGN